MAYKKTSIIILACVSIAVLVLSFKEKGKPALYKYPALKAFPKMPPSDNEPTVEGAALGRYLFYDTILSANYTFSCGSCHRQEVAFSDAPNRFSTGINGNQMRRNTLPLFNLAWYPSLFWDGKVPSIEAQVFHPVRAHDEMNLDWTTATERIQNSDFYRTKFQDVFGYFEPIDSMLIAKAIAQFERTLISSNSKFDKVLRGETYLSSDEYEGFILMNDQTKGSCLHCHTTDANALGTIAGFSNIGLDPYNKATDYTDSGKATITHHTKDIGWFKIPSLRNVAVTAPYMHDGRFNTLEEVLDFYSEGVHAAYNIDSRLDFAHQGGTHLTDDEKRKIILFIKTMTDYSFLNNREFSNPFKK